MATTSFQPGGYPGRPYGSFAGRAAAPHTTTGVLVGPGSTVVGTADHRTLHTTTGVLVGPGSVVNGTATRLALHTTSGILVGPGSVITGAATGPSILPPAALAEMYGGGAMYPRKKKKKKEEIPSIETMVRAIADDPQGKVDVIKVLPKAVQEQFQDPGIVALYELIDKLEAATVPVQKKLEHLYRQRQEEDDDDAIMLLLM
jgi:hypothetical protein